MRGRSGDPPSGLWGLGHPSSRSPPFQGGGEKTAAIRPFVQRRRCRRVLAAPSALLPPFRGEVGRGVPRRRAGRAAGHPPGPPSRGEERKRRRSALSSNDDDAGESYPRRLRSSPLSGGRSGGGSRAGARVGGGGSSPPPPLPGGRREGGAAGVRGRSGDPPSGLRSLGHPPPDLPPCLLSSPLQGGGREGGPAPARGRVGRRVIPPAPLPGGRREGGPARVRRRPGDPVRSVPGRPPPDLPPSRGEETAPTGRARSYAFPQWGIAGGPANGLTARAAGLRVRFLRVIGDGALAGARQSTRSVHWRPRRWRRGGTACSTA